MRRLGTILAFAFLALAPPTLAVQPDEILGDPALEARAREIGQELRCLVCQNQSIDDSDADLARDLRILVRERLKAGDSNDEVLAFMKARYGDFVLLKPPMTPATWLLWFGPALIAAAGIAGVVMFYRRRRDVSPEPELTPAEKKRLAEALGEPPGERRA